MPSNTRRLIFQQLHVYFPTPTLRNCVNNKSRCPFFCRTRAIVNPKRVKQEKSLTAGVFISVLYMLDTANISTDSTRIISDNKSG